MKRSKAIFFGAAALILSACSSTGDGPDPKPSPSGKGFIRISLSSGNGIGTRAPEDNITSAQECNIKNFTLAFYDATGTYISQIPITRDIALNPASDGPNPTYTETIEIPLSPLSSGQSENRTVVCYINTPAGFQAPMSLNETTEVSTWLDGTHFTMSSTVYFDSKGELKKGSLLGKIFSSQQEATNAEETEITKIYVERLASKTRVTDGLNLTDFDQKGLTANNVTELKFTVDGWALTATSKASSMIKQFGEYSTKDALNGLLKNVPENRTLYDPDNFQTYWAITSFFNGATKDNLVYKTFDEAANSGIKLGESNWDYCLEHALKNPAADLSANTSVLIAGHYTIGNAAAEDLFTYGKKTSGTASYPYLYTKQGLLTKIASDFQIKKGDNIATAEDLSPIIGFTATDESISVVKLTLTSSTADGFTVAGQPLTQENLDTRLANMPRIRMYEGGKGFYWVPIEHFGIENGVTTGSFGVIRNIAYNIDITGVNKLAAPVAKSSASIIPEEEDALNYLKFSITVLDWKLWNTQGAILGK